MSHYLRSTWRRLLKLSLVRLLDGLWSLRRKKKGVCRYAGTLLKYEYWLFGIEHISIILQCSCFAPISFILSAFCVNVVLLFCTKKKFFY